MKIVRGTNNNVTPSLKLKDLFDDECRRKLGLQFIAAHNKKIQKMKDKGTYDQWINKK